MLTFIRSLTTVCAKMHSQATGMPKAGMAVLTRERLLTGVYPAVLLQVPWLSKGSITIAACVRLLACVNTHVACKVPIIRVHSLAVLACVLPGAPHRFLPHVNERVILQVLCSCESGPAVEAGEGSQAQMYPAMLCQLTGGCEGHPAFIAEVQLQPLVTMGVVPEGTRVGECCPTSCAAVRLDPAVPASVSGQHAGVCKGLAALVAQKWTFT